MIPRNEIGVVTVWQPMAWCIEIGIKKIENRTIEPWKSIKYIAIHAGLSFVKYAGGAGFAHYQREPVFQEQFRAA